MKVLCFGSLNIDYTYKVEHIVTPGEKLLHLKDFRSSEEEKD